MRRCHLAAVFAVLLAALGGFVSPAFAAPPALDAKPALADNLTQGKWQTLLVTLQNPDSGEALEGEIQVALEDSRQQTRLATYVAPVRLPRGAATVRVPVTIFVPFNGLPDVSVFVVNGRNGQGEVITRRRFDKFPLLPNMVTVLAVSSIPDALQKLQGEKLGVFVGNSGGLRKASPPTPANKKSGSSYSYGRNTERVAMPVNIVNRPDAGVLPTKTVAYDRLSMVYLGRDVLPDTFSDAQINALRGWVAGGGVLVVANPKLRTDERFRQWLPLPSASATPLGRGTIFAPTVDPGDSVFAASGQFLPFWRNAAQSGITSVGVINALTNTDYNGSYLWGTLFRAPGLQAPGAGAIGVFLAAYLFLLVPLNYFILRRLGKREWMWATAPVLVLMFSLGAYGFGYATKGTQLYQNVATVSEMQNGSGEAATCGGIGLFSPRRARYAVQVGVPDAVLWTPNQNEYGSAEYPPLVVSENESGNGQATGAIARGSEVSMWAMRSWAFRTNQPRLGNGIDARLTRNPNGQITGVVTNNTGKPVKRVWVSFWAQGQNLGDLKSGETRKVAFGPKTPDKNKAAKNKKMAPPPYGTTKQLFDPKESSEAGDYDYTRPNRTNPNKTQTPEELKKGFQNSVASGVQMAYFSSTNNNGVPLSDPSDEAFVTAFTDDVLVPVAIDGQSVNSGMNAHVLLVHVPLPAPKK